MPRRGAHMKFETRVQTERISGSLRHQVVDTRLAETRAASENIWRRYYWRSPEVREVGRDGTRKYEARHCVVVFARGTTADADCSINSFRERIRQRCDAGVTEKRLDPMHTVARRRSSRVIRKTCMRRQRVEAFGYSCGG